MTPENVAQELIVIERKIAQLTLDVAATREERARICRNAAKEVMLPYLDKGGGDMAKAFVDVLNDWDNGNLERS
jgi:hypothetical protein